MHEYPSERADVAIAHLARVGFTPTILIKLATFQVHWTMFESMLELTIWALKGEDPKGVHPSTDAKQASALINMFEAHSTELPNGFSATVKLASATAHLLLRYRNGISHGFVLPKEIGGPGFLSNPMWHGEKRKRPHADSLVNEESLDLALYAVLAIREVQLFAKDATEDRAVLTWDNISRMNSRIRTAWSMANELVHRAALYNHEKY